MLGLAWRGACGAPLLCAFLAAGCGDSGATTDTGTSGMDAGAMDAGSTDVGPPDTGPPPYGLETLVYNATCVVETRNPDGTIDVPTLISETGCYDDPARKIPNPAFVPFDINSKLWTDGALKRRFVALPPGTHIGYEPDLSWDMPVGTIMMKEFILETDETDETALFTMETRFLVKYDPLFWQGYSYRWDATGTDATLVSVDAMASDTGSYEVSLAGGGTRMHEHYFPSQAECLQCHPPRGGGVNGLQTRQVNRDFDYTLYGGAAVDNQLRTFEHIGMFRNPLPDLPALLPRMPDPKDTTASLGDRARAYLHANCAHCHRREGSAITSTLWIPYESDIEDTNACVGRDFGGTAGDVCENVNDRIVPGDTDNSLIACLMAANDMPPVGTLLPDPARQVVFDWIESLSSCP